MNAPLSTDQQPLAIAVNPDVETVKLDPTTKTEVEPVKPVESDLRRRMRARARRRTAGFRCH